MAQQFADALEAAHELGSGSCAQRGSDSHPDLASSQVSRVRLSPV
jgi:hypothetical protein